MKFKNTYNVKKQASRRLGLLFILALSAMTSSTLQAQTFDSGSDGSNGVLNLTLAQADANGVILFDPQALGLVPDENNAYHFTTINVEAGVTVRLRADILGLTPVIWLASGDVIIDGTLDLNGENGNDYNEPTRVAIGGAGGFEGGVGSREFAPATPGQGPGGGNTSTSQRGGGAGHFNVVTGGGDSYGNNFLIPLLGGSGGAGGGEALPVGLNGDFGAGGGAGGGAILIASSTQIQVTGSISCAGGEGGEGVFTGSQQGGGFKRGGGGGSGGSIRLVANILKGSGNLSANGGRGGSNGLAGLSGSFGRIRTEAFDNQFNGTVTPLPVPGVPISVFPKSINIPSVQVTRISGLSVPPNGAVSVDLPLAPNGSFAPADIVIEETENVTFEIEASNVPPGTVVNLTLHNETEGTIDFSSTPLAGTLENSTATATVTIPSGFSRFFVEANW